MQGNQQLIGTVVTIAFVVLILALRLRRMRQVRPLKIEQLWILPAIYGVLAVLLFVAHPPQGLVWVYALAGLAVGCAIGWYRGKLMKITVDPQTHALSQQGSMAAVIFIVLLLLVRYAARYYALSDSGANPDTMFAATDVLLASGLGFIGAQRAEMGIRARRLLLKAQADVFD